MGKYQGVEPTARGTCAVIKKNIGNFGRERGGERENGSVAGQGSLGMQGGAWGVFQIPLVF